MVVDVGAGTEEDIIYSHLKLFQEGILFVTVVLLHLVYLITSWKLEDSE